ncbi:hypothetical protein B0T24DRAFT_680993 [Lasiosphaeria ovina]|uniref:F-box domain-containing protein n=1 Tax=Lasiosphaeria ovina TaxID=92902 RepID=A0AAE0N3J6_9PEZI|nr:hypothetical protein B0T24DRAFT_680993 [Lasiosphaeria ovina]
MASADPDPQPAPAQPALTFTRLPREVQKDIVSHCSQSDLICLSLVSKHFRELAAAQLYRNFHIVFPDEDDPAFDSPIDGLAGGLDTFVTSDYDYAKHLRDLSLDTLSAGDKGEAAYKPYLYNVSCGKFMNTLLLLTLRKASALESFRWNIRVELSRPVYKALHQIDTLRHLHLRLQAGPSLYETPPPLPYNGSQVTPSMPAHHVPSVAPPPPVQQSIFGIPPPPSAFYIPPSSAPPPPIPKPIARARAPRRTSLSKEPPTLAGFKQLKTLSVLDIDTLDLVAEIKTCIKNSYGSLSKLKLSFSDSLAMQARKPPPDLDPEDSDPEDEFHVPVPPSGNYHDATAPAKVFRAQEEKKSQESVLGRIFDVEPPAPKPRRLRLKERDAKDEPGVNPGRDFITAIKTVSSKLMKDLNGVSDFSSSQQEILDTIESAARKYVAAEEAKFRDEKQQDKTADAGPSSTSVAQPSQAAEASTSAGDTSVSLFDQPAATKVKENQKDADPEDINIEEPEEQLVIEQDAPPTTDAPASEPLAPTSDSSSESPPLAEGASASIDDVTTKKDTAAQKLVLEAGQLEFKEDLEEVETETDRAVGSLVTEQQGQGSVETDSQNQRINEYLRATRGLALQSLGVYLIPVKASVLSRAIDLRVLKRLTLLNVGIQAPFWLHLQKENKESPLPLRKIFTDNVSMVFLTFVSTLEELHELFILERDSKYKPESFAPSTTVTIEQIRRLALKKHMPTLKRLMIKNQADTAWDIDEKTTALICKRGKQLEELACNMGIKAVHAFMQRLAGLVNLRALHIVQLRNDDTCVWVMRETKRFLIDNLSHHPEMKLEWISIDDEDRVERLVRPSSTSKKDRDSKKSKGKQVATSSGVVSNDVFPVLPQIDMWNVSSDSEDDYEDGDFKNTKIETIENLHFYDVWGVRIFKKEVLFGRL